MHQSPIRSCWTPTVSPRLLPARSRRSIAGTTNPTSVQRAEHRRDNEHALAALIETVRPDPVGATAVVVYCKSTVRADDRLLANSQRESCLLVLCLEHAPQSADAPPRGGSSLCAGTIAWWRRSGGLRASSRRETLMSGASLCDTSTCPWRAIHKPASCSTSLASQGRSRTAGRLVALLKLGALHDVIGAERRVMSCGWVAETCASRGRHARWRT